MRCTLESKETKAKVKLGFGSIIQINKSINPHKSKIYFLTGKTFEVYYSRHLKLKATIRLVITGLLGAQSKPENNLAG